MLNDIILDYSHKFQYRFIYECCWLPSLKYGRLGKSKPKSNLMSNQHDLSKFGGGPQSNSLSVNLVSVYSRSIRMGAANWNKKDDSIKSEFKSRNSNLKMTYELY